MRKLLLICALAGWGLTGCQSRLQPVPLTVAPGQVIKAEVVASPAAVSQGLSGRTALAADAGMLFLFNDSGRHAFWMQGMKFSLDIIWLQRRQVVDIWPNAPIPVNGQPPAQYQPTALADMVLEVPAGRAQAWGLKIGDQLSWPDTLDLRQLAR